MKYTHFARLDVYWQSAVGEIELILILQRLSVVCKCGFSCHLIQGKMYGGNLFLSGGSNGEVQWLQLTHVILYRRKKMYKAG